ncbi:MAG: phosphotransferase [Alphaproteobacteria bacterium]|nr:phosphotransferase [Alphaproteobacteria bacterium]
MKSERDHAADRFLAANGWGDAERRPLAGDASFRRYERIVSNAGDQVVLMDAPPPQEDVRPFVTIARHLTKLGLSAPQILAADEDQGFLLLEDLGDGTYTHLLADGHDEKALYALATDALIHLHKTPAADAIPAGVVDYGEDRLLEEVDRLNVWYLPLVETAPLPAEARKDYLDLWRKILPAAWQTPRSLVLFDYHVDNLLLLTDRTGVAACGLLDFQDAVHGPVTYDLMSLLEDARRDINPALVVAMKARYRAAFPNITDDDFDTSWAVMAAQRHIRVIGTFARLKLRDGKPHYLEHMPRLWNYMDSCLTHPVLAPLKEWLDKHVPTNLRAISK